MEREREPLRCAVRLAAVSVPTSGPALGVVHGDRVFDLSPALPAKARGWTELGAVLAEGPDGMALVRAAAERVTAEQEGFSTADVGFRLPISAPRHVLCVAANYRAHIEETGTIQYAPKVETCPWFFHKPHSSLNPHGAAIRLPATLGRKVDWEAELGVVIGRRASHVAEEKAFDYIAGYTVINDISARKMAVPERTTIRDRDKFHDWLHGKWFDTFCCVGPWMTTTDELGEAGDVSITLDVSGTRYQDGSTSDMLFGISELLAFISRIVTLEPGDLIATGTPSGVGKAQGRFLQPGDVVTTTVEGVGSLVNPVVAGE